MTRKDAGKGYEVSIVGHEEVEKETCLVVREQTYHKVVLALPFVHQMDMVYDSTFQNYSWFCQSEGDNCNCSKNLVG